jgi:hypothetical protein
MSTFRYIMRRKQKFALRERSCSLFQSVVSSSPDVLSFVAGILGSTKRESIQFRPGEDNIGSPWIGLGL